MASEFSTNIREIAAELKLMDRKFATAVRRAIRVTVTDAAASTTAAIRAKASEQGLDRAAAATGVKLSFSVRSGGAKIATNQKRAPYARPLERGSKGSDGSYNKHPVFGSPTSGKRGSLARYNNKKSWPKQATRPFFYGSALAQEPLSEEKLLVAVEAACVEAGFRL